MHPLCPPGTLPIRKDFGKFPPRQSQPPYLIRVTIQIKPDSPAGLRRAAAPPLRADTVVPKNGERLTGTAVKLDGGTGIGAGSFPIPVPGL